MNNKIEFKVCNQGNNVKAYEECDEFIKKWQKILKIQDWKIELHFLSAAEVADEIGETGEPGYLAFCTRDHRHKIAKICLNAEHKEINDNMEHTLIHEMLHIVLSEYQYFYDEVLKSQDEIIKITARMHLEQTINMLADSFWKVVNE